MRRIRKRDWGFFALVLVHMIGIAGFLAGGFDEAGSTTGGYRRIDIEAVKSMIREGDLVDREADWYRVLPETRGER